jgi:hypothetical protein
LVWISKGNKPFGKNPNNSPKLSLGMTFKHINLDGITCAKKFEDPSQVANWAYIENLKRFEFELATRFEL